MNKATEFLKSKAVDDGIAIVTLKVAEEALQIQAKEFVDFIRKNCPVIYKSKGKYKEYGVTEEELQTFLGDKVEGVKKQLAPSGTNEQLSDTKLSGGRYKKSAVRLDKRISSHPSTSQSKKKAKP